MPLLLSAGLKGKATTTQLLPNSSGTLTLQFEFSHLFSHRQGQALTAGGSRVVILFVVMISSVAK